MEIQSAFSPLYSKQLGCLQYHAWQIAYRGLLPDDILEMETEDKMIEKWKIILSSAEEWLKQWSLNGEGWRMDIRTGAASNKREFQLISAIQEALGKYNSNPRLFQDKFKMGCKFDYSAQYIEEGDIILNKSMDDNSNSVKESVVHLRENSPTTLIIKASILIRYFLIWD